MPREIIDTQSSRPAYLRRRIATFIGVAVGLLALAAAGWVYWSHIALPAH
ncbi:MAG: hypothetical protein ABI231_09565 [Candidatus Tumulicola sp.]